MLQRTAQTQSSEPFVIYWQPACWSASGFLLCQAFDAIHSMVTKMPCNQQLVNSQEWDFGYSVRSEYF